MSVTLNHHPPAAVADSELSKWRGGVWVITLALALPLSRF